MQEQQLLAIMLPSKREFVCSSPYPVTGGLGNIFTNLLGRQTERTDLGGQSRLGSDLTTSGPQVAIREEMVSICDTERIEGLELT